MAALPQLFAPYFSDKISKLHFNLQTNPSSTPVSSRPSSLISLFHSCTPATLLEIDNLLSQSSDSYCDLDPIPPLYLRKLLTNYPAILSIVNLSITTGTFPSTLKSYICSPLLKTLYSIKKICLMTAPCKPLLYLQSNRKIVKKRLLHYLTSSSSLNSFQSAYTKFNPTEITLPSVHDHLTNAISKHQVSCLCLLDLSAAVDTLDHCILLRRLSTLFGISSLLLQWLISYLSFRTSAVHIPPHIPPSALLTCGVSKGSVLGPVLFNLYHSS